MENKTEFMIIYFPMLIALCLFIVGWRLCVISSRKRKYISFTEFMQAAGQYLKAEQDREKMKHLHPLDFALMHYEFYLNERKVDPRKVEEITKYRFRARGYFESHDEEVVERNIKRFL